MYIYLLILRILHIGCGVFWAGTALFLAFFVFPAVIKAGPDGSKITQAIMGTNKMPTVMTFISFITVLTGILLMWNLSAGFTAEWFTYKYGISLTIGGITATIAFFQALLINRPGAMRMQAVGQAIAKRGGPPTPEEQQEMGKLRARIFLSTRWIAVWIIISVVTMGVARYI
jgi:uncharacterized membrane protein